jgi:hypothetical protein
MSLDYDDGSLSPLGPCVSLWVPVTCGGYFGSGYSPEYALRFAVLTRGRGLGLCLDMTKKTAAHVGQLTSKQKQDLGEFEHLAVFTHEHELGPAPPGTSKEGLPTGPPENGGPAAPLVAQMVELGGGAAGGDERSVDSEEDVERYECCRSCDMQWYARMYGQEAADKAYGVRGEIY